MGALLSTIKPLSDQLFELLRGIKAEQVETNRLLAELTVATVLVHGDEAAERVNAGIFMLREELKKEN